MTSESRNQNKLNKEEEQHPEDLYVITENGEQCFLWRANQLTYIAQDRHELPAILATKFGHLATRLDLSYNSLTSFNSINSFTNLNELILDNNLLEDHQLEFTLNLRLKTLSLNKNKLCDLYKLVNSIKVCLPNLEYLSLIGNPLCPGPLLRTPPDKPQVRARETGDVIESGVAPPDAGSPESFSEILNQLGSATRVCGDNYNNSSEFSQQKYRHFIIYHLPNLRFLDSSPITASERDEALRRCFWMSQAAGVGPSEPSAQPRPPSPPPPPPARTSSVLQRAAKATAVRQRHHSENSTSSGADDQQQEFKLTIMSGGSGEAGIAAGSHRTKDTDNAREQAKAVFSRLAYKYTGKNSEGNRFIRNQDL